MINAITDAIGVRVEMPATPEKVWAAMQGMAHAAECGEQEPTDRPGPAEAESEALTR